MCHLSPLEQSILDALLTRRPDLAGCVADLFDAHATLVAAYDQGGKLLTCGNGGSCADAVHIVGELCKSFERKRPLDETFQTRLVKLPHGAELAENLEQGLTAVTLGLNHSLKTAVENDSPLRDMAFAQEAHALLKKGDVLLAISTSGNATNCLMAMSAAKATECTTIVLTGPKGGVMGEHGDVVIRAPGASTSLIQESHIALYHTLCLMIEAHYFSERR